MSVVRHDLFGARRPAMAALLDNLHRTSLAQERETSASFPRSTDKSDLATFEDKLVALDKDKAEAMYLLLRATNARRIFEAGTSYGVSTCYLLAATRDNVVNGSTVDSTQPAKVWGSENEPTKVKRAMSNIAQCFSTADEWSEIQKDDQFTILEGDVIQSINDENFARNSIDALLLDIWAPVALPVLQALSPALRPGAVVLIDNSTPNASRYADLHRYLDDAQNGWKSVVLPFHNGFEMAVRVA